MIETKVATFVEEKTADVVVEKKEEPVKEEKQLSNMEQQALAMGWRPREEFEGEDDEFIDAKEFVRRKPLFDRLEQQSKQLKNVNKTLEQLKGHYTKMREVEFNRALAELKSARKQALTDSDGDRFEAIDDRIKEVEKEAEKLRVEDEVQNARPVADPAEFQAWRGRNSWYQKDEAMTAFADRIGLKHQEEVTSGVITPLQILQKVEQAVRAEFPHKFKNPNKETAPDVGKSSNTGSSKSKTIELDETETKIMNNFVRQGIMTKEQYLSDLKKAKGIA
jgi:hypothetical protein